MRLPTPGDIKAAADRIAPYVVRTPLLRSPVLDERAGATLLIKAEPLQRTGSFKIRGAYNRLLLMTEAERASGVVAWSAGNHGQALAYAGRELGTHVTVVMPADAPQAKIERTRRWGARVVFYDRLRQSREDIGRQIARDTGAQIVPPYDDADVIAGQGTAGLEALQDAAVMGYKPSRLLCCTGGGGLIAGCALAAQALGSNVLLHPCEPVGYDDTGRSLALGHRVENDVSQPSISDALMTVTPGVIPFSINQRYLSSGLAVDDDAVKRAMRLALQELKLVIEPGGAAALAAAFTAPQVTGGQTVIVMATGGNMDLSLLATIVEGLENS